MDSTSLHNFYKYALLPRFGIHSDSIQWGEAKRIDGDEIIHPFTIEDTSYVLLFEDYADTGRTKEYIDGFVLPPGTKFTFIEPVTSSAMTPSYNSRQLTGPVKYRENITGIFTLMQLL